VAAGVLADVEDADPAGVFGDEPAVRGDPLDDDELGDEEVEEFVPVVSASAMAGLLAIAAPTPSAIASTPTRPMYLPADALATALLTVGALFTGALFRSDAVIMLPPLPTPDLR
jgi:hypothetical protein